MLNSFKKFASNCHGDGFVVYQWSDSIIVRGKQIFADFGGIAYDVSKQKFLLDGCALGSGKLCVPINGRYLGAFPDEGPSGIMGCYIVTRAGKNILTQPTFVPCGWLYTSELGLTNSEITQNILDEME